MERKSQKTNNGEKRDLAKALGHSIKSPDTDLFCDGGSGRKGKELAIPSCRTMRKAM